jgi:hypothetical protein
MTALTSPSLTWKSVIMCPDTWGCGIWVIGEAGGQITMILCCMSVPGSKLFLDWSLQWPYNTSFSCHAQNMVHRIWNISIKREITNTWKYGINIHVFLTGNFWMIDQILHQDILSLCWLGMVTHAYIGGWGKKMKSSRLAWATPQDPVSKKQKQ